MALPDYDERGLLPPGIHSAIWSDVVARFGGTAARDALLVALHDALVLLASVGCQRVWLDGSFVTDVETQAGRPPRDVDVCWNVAGVDVERLATTAPELHPLLGDPVARRRRFGGDYFLVTEPIAIGQVEALQFNREGERKGIVLLMLHEETL